MKLDNQILTNDVQMVIFCLSYIITTVKGNSALVGQDSFFASQNFPSLFLLICTYLKIHQFVYIEQA